MTWVIKAGSPNGGAYDGPPEYLHNWELGAHNQITDTQWVTDQKLAHRFDDRNYAAKKCNQFPINAYSDDVRIVKLVPKAALSSGSATEKK